MPEKNPAAVALGRLGGMKTRDKKLKEDENYFKSLGSQGGKKKAENKKEKDLSTDILATDR